MSDENNQDPNEVANVNQLLKEREKILLQVKKAQEDLVKVSDEYKKSLREGNLDLDLKTKHLRAQQGEQQKVLDFLLQTKETAEAIGADQSIQKGLDDQIAKAKEARDSYKEGADAIEDMVPHAQQVASYMGFDKKWEQTLWGSMAKDGFPALGTRLQAFAGGLMQAMRPADLLGSTLMKIQESTLLAIWNFDNASASLAAATGQGTRYNDMIMDVSDSNRSFGVSIDGAAQAIQGLNDSMSGFSDASSEVQTALVAQTARLEKLGVAASTTGKMNDQFMKGMGMTAQEAMAVNDDLARTAMGIGVPVGKMAQEFENAMPALAQYGKDAPKIFKKVMAAAKGLGVEMGTLLGFTSQFDTFEGAASAVGKLNNILGGDLLNSYEMINASEEERIRLLLQGVESSGKSWTSMNRFERMAVANAAGITDMAEANKMFSGGLAGYDEAQRKAQENAVSQKELEERTQAAVSVQEKMKMVLEQMAVAVQPIVAGLHSFFNVILGINDATGGALVPIVLGAVAAFALLDMWVGFSAKGTAILAAIQGKKAATLTASQMAAMNAAAADKALAASQTQAALACDKETLCKQMNTGAKVQNTAATGANSTAAGVNATQENMSTAAAQANTTAKGLNSTATGLNTASEVQNAAATGASTVQEGLNTTATGVNTTATGANTAAKNMGILASLRMAAASAFATAKTIALSVAEKAAAVGRWALGAASGFLAKMFGVQAVAQAKVATTAAPAAGGLMGLAAGMAALGTPPAILAVAALAAIALGLGMVAIAGAIVVYSIVSLVKAFMQMPGAILPAILGLGMFMATMLVFVGLVALMAPIIPLFIVSAIGIGYGLMAMAPGLLAGSVALAVFGAAMKLFDGDSFKAMLGLTFLMVPFALAMMISAPMIATAGMMVPALIGLGIGFAALGVGLLIATLGIPSMVALTYALPLFAVSLMASAPLMMMAAGMMAPAAIALGIAFAVLGIGLFIGTLGIPGMILLSIFLPSFAMSLLAAAIPMGMAAASIAPAAIALGIGFAVLGVGLAIATLGIPGMILLSIFLPMFAAALLSASIPFGMAAVAIAPAAMLLGVGLAVLGTALMLFGLETVLIMALIGPALAILAMGLNFAAPLMITAGLLFAPAALLVGAGLLLIGMALLLFNDKTIPVMAMLGPTLVLFALSLVFAAPMMWLAAGAFAPAALLVGLGLLALGMGLKLFDRKTARTMMKLAPALVAFGLGLLFASFPLYIGGMAFTQGALAASVGLFVLGLALKVFNKKSWKVMEGLAIALPIFSMAILQSAFPLLLGGWAFGLGVLAVSLPLVLLALALKAWTPKETQMMKEIGDALPFFAAAIMVSGTPLLWGALPFMIGALLVAPGLAMLGWALQNWEPGAGQLLQEIGLALPIFAAGIFAAAVPLFYAALPFFIAALFLAPALAMLAGPLYAFGEAIAIIAPYAEQLPAIGDGFAKMGPGLSAFAWGMLSVGLAASLPFFSTGIGVFRNALEMLAESFEAVPTEKAVAMGQFFEGLAALSDLKNIADVMWEVAWGVIGVSSALAILPEEKAFAMSTMLNSVSEASVKVTPEAVENVTGLVEQAAVYADVQAKYKAPSVDAFVQALKQVQTSSADSKGSDSSGSGRDIVLELNGREIGRAIDVHLDDKHNLRTN